MGHFSREGDTLVWQENQQRLWLQPWGESGLRVRANLSGRLLDLPQALLEPSSDSSVDVLIGEEKCQYPEWHDPGEC